MTDLIAFLRARLDEEEQAARDLGGATWTSQEDGTITTSSITSPTRQRIIAEGLREYVAEWAATHDPARVLAEVNAKRGIIVHHGPGHDCDDLIWTEPPCSTLRNLAVVYADHPDYRGAWRP